MTTDGAQGLDRIELRGLAAHGHHGVHEYERRDGQRFVVDVVVHTDTRPAAAGDALRRTLDYGVLASQVVAVLTGPPVALLETLAERIAATVLAHPQAVATEVTVHKPHAPLLGQPDAVSAAVEFADVVVSVRRDRDRVPVVEPAAVPDRPRHLAGWAAAGRAPVLAASGPREVAEPTKAPLPAETTDADAQGFDDQVADHDAPVDGPDEAVAPDKPADDEGAADAVDEPDADGDDVSDTADRGAGSTADLPDDGEGDADEAGGDVADEAGDEPDQVDEVDEVGEEMAQWDEPMPPSIPPATVTPTPSSQGAVVVTPGHGPVVAQLASVGDEFEVDPVGLTGDEDEAPAEPEHEERDPVRSSEQLYPPASDHEEHDSAYVSERPYPPASEHEGRDSAYVSERPYPPASEHEGRDPAYVSERPYPPAPELVPAPARHEAAPPWADSVADAREPGSSAGPAGDMRARGGSWEALDVVAPEPPRSEPQADELSGGRYGAPSPDPLGHPGLVPEAQWGGPAAGPEAPAAAAPLPPWDQPNEPVWAPSPSDPVPQAWSAPAVTGWPSGPVPISGPERVGDDQAWPSPEPVDAAWPEAAAGPGAEPSNGSVPASTLSTPLPWQDESAGHGPASPPEPQPIAEPGAGAWPPADVPGPAMPSPGPAQHGPPQMPVAQAVSQADPIAWPSDSGTPIVWPPEELDHGGHRSGSPDGPAQSEPWHPSADHWQGAPPLPTTAPAGSGPPPPPLPSLSFDPHAPGSPGGAAELDQLPSTLVDVVIGVGGNLGPVQETLRWAVHRLGALTGLEITAVGPLARTAATDRPDQPDFLNTIILGRTLLSARDLLRRLAGVEQEAGRERLERWGPRTLDLDLIKYGDLVASDDELTLPHPQAHQRAFVLGPWGSADPAAVLPGPNGGPVAQLAERAPDTQGVRWMALDWLTDTPREPGAA